MRYKCIANPHCLKTFEYGHALRAHLASCDLAQKQLRSRADVEKLENDISLEYAGIYGLHRNPYYPTSHHLDKTSKLFYADKHRFTSNPTLAATYKKQKKASLGTNMFSSAQVKNCLTSND